jgi:demethylmenaquinone methyltransferase/2-methoxy-6-polyprenyl-1,4-benzoquinol methylase
VPDLDHTFREYLRVLKPEGRVLLLEITRPASRVGLALARIYFRSLVPLVTRMATGSADAAELMRFYWDTIQMCVPPETVIEALTRAGFAKSGRVVEYGIFSEYTGVRSVAST